jgi:hypothetical protein
MLMVGIVFVRMVAIKLKEIPKEERTARLRGEGLGRREKQ